MALTRKRKMFVEGYLRTWSATQAAIEAGYSKRTAYSQGPRLLKIVEVAEEIDRRIAEVTMSADEVLIRLTEQARGKYANYINVAGSLDIARMVIDEKAYLIKAIRPGLYGTTYEFVDSQAALSLLGRNHRLFTDRVEHGADEPLTNLLDNFNSVLSKIYGQPSDGKVPDDGKG